MTKKVFRCPTKEELEAHRPKSGKRFGYFSINEVKYIGFYPENEKTGTQYDLYTHVYVYFTKEGVIQEIVCGDRRGRGFYVTVPFSKKNNENTKDFSGKDVTFDRTLAVPSPDGYSYDLKLPLDTEFRVQMH